MTTEGRDLDALVATIDALHARVDELEARLADAERRPPAPPANGPVSRRALFGLAGAGVAGMVLGDTAPAAAADGDPLLLGQSNSSTTVTQLSSTDSRSLILRSSGQPQSVALEIQDSEIGVLSDADSVGVWGLGETGVNGWALEVGGCGVRGTAPEAFGFGVEGIGDRFIGVLGTSVSGIGGAFLSESGPQLLLTTNGVFSERTPVIGPPPEFNLRGALAADDAGDLWFCIEDDDGNSPGTWTRLNQQTALFDASQRAFDSRTTGGKFANGQTRTIDLTTDTDLPDDARTAIVTLSVTDTTGAGFASIYSAASPVLNPPEFASITWTATGQTISNTLPVAIDGGQIRIYAHRSAHVVIDVIGHNA